jgi:tetratricopeptide (TPR) repeat protein
MSENLFIPRMQHTPNREPSDAVSPKDDPIGGMFHKVAQYVIVFLLGMTPVIFTPGLWASLGFDKIIAALVCGAIVVIVMGFLSLRRKKATTILPLTLGLFWMTAFAAFASGFISGDTQDALRGSLMETQTAGFFSLLALTMTIPLVLQKSKEMTIKALAFFGIMSILLMVYTSSRFILGVDFLPLGSFLSVTSTPIGLFNDLAIFAGLSIIISLVTLVQLPIRTALQCVISALVILSLFVLMVVNFFNVWLAVGFFAFIILMYLLSRDTIFRNAENTPIANLRTLIILTLLICITSVIFVLAGDYAGKKMSDLTNVEYVEVRPSMNATLGIIKAVYKEDALFGVGANRFSDAWRLYKDPNINETIFWDTDFTAGSGFVPTVFVNLGLLGGILLVAFHLGLLYLGYRMLLRPSHRDPYWYYFGVASFTAACFLWGMSYIYVPGTSILLLSALFTGFVFVAAASLIPQSTRSISLMSNRQRGFFLMSIVIVLTVASVGSLFTVGKQYIAEARFNEASQTATTPAEIIEAATSAFELYPDERFKIAHALVQLVTVTSLLGVQDPSDEQQQTFLSAAEAALVSAEEAMKLDLSDPDHHAVLAGVYSNLAIAGVSGAQMRATTELAEAQRLDPQNPSYHLITAQIAARVDDMETARTEVTKALELKRNFTEAMYLSAQLDITEGKTDSAIETTRSIITLEPKNPTRYFQLGVLLSATNQLPEAVAAYRAAITLDPQYANARYLLAIAYLNSGETEAALEQLRVVLETNQDNQQLLDLVQQVESGQYKAPESTGFEAPINEQLGGESNEGVITPGDVDSRLVTPVNTISETEQNDVSNPSAPLTAEVKVDNAPVTTDEAGTQE